MNFIQKKVPKGKMLQLEKNDSGYKITGDFFCHPETLIEDLQDILTNSQPETIPKKIEKIFKNKEYTIVGFEAKDLLELYKNIH